jgi:hypothetical protein
VYHGLIHNRYGDVLVKNSDGIDLRQGYHHITIENITVFTQDDAVALTAKDFEGTQAEVRATVAEICEQFPMYR